MGRRKHSRLGAEDQIGRSRDGVEASRAGEPERELVVSMRPKVDLRGDKDVRDGLVQARARTGRVVGGRDRAEDIGDLIEGIVGEAPVVALPTRRKRKRRRSAEIRSMVQRRIETTAYRSHRRP